MKIGDKAIWIPINFATREVERNHPHFNKTVTIIEERDNFGRYRISVDDFPQVNHRDRVNRFYADEVELMEVENVTQD